MENSHSGQQRINSLKLCSRCIAQTGIPKQVDMDNFVNYYKTIIVTSVCIYLEMRDLCTLSWECMKVNVNAREWGQVCERRYILEIMHVECLYPLKKR